MARIERLALVAILGTSAIAAAQTENAETSREARDREAIRALLPTGDDPDDPLSIGDTASLHDVQAPPEPEEPDPHAHGPAAPDIEPGEGEVLRAVAGVREVSHRISIRLVDGLALVEHAWVLSNRRGRYAAEAEYRLALPRGAHASALEVCAESQCRSAVPDTSLAYDEAVRARGPEHAAPVARMTRRQDALLISAAPVMPGKELALKVQYLAPAPVRGGTVRLQLPPRGNDLRIVASAIHVDAEGLLAPRLQGAVVGTSDQTVEPWVAVEVSADMPSGGGPRLSAQTFACGEHRCARLRASAGPRSAERQDVVLLLDASPSMRGPAQGRLNAAVGGLLSAMHPGSRVRALAFGGRAESLLSEAKTPHEVPLTALSRTGSLDLGSATRFEAVWQALRGHVRRGTHLIIVGDGGLSGGSEQLRAMREAGRMGVRASAVNLAAREPSATLLSLVRVLDGQVVQAAQAVDLAARGRRAGRLEERLAPLFAPALSEVSAMVDGQRAELGSLIAGEELTWTGRIQRRATVRSAQSSIRATPATVVAADAFQGLGMHIASVPPQWSAVSPEDIAVAGSCMVQGPPQRQSGVSSDALPVALASERDCRADPAPTPEQESGRGVPAETVLQMLRHRIVPVARGCFRRDRGGRPAYSVRAVFELELSDREITSSEVHGEITSTLRSCLTAAIDNLEIPYFEGKVVVRYPLRTEREELPATIELSGDVAGAVDRVLSP